MQKATDVELLKDSKGQMYLAFRFMNSPGLVYIEINPKFGMDVGEPAQIKKDKKAREEQLKLEEELRKLEEEKNEKKRKKFEKKRQKMMAELAKEGAELGIDIDKEYKQKEQELINYKDLVNQQLNHEFDYASTYNEEKGIVEPQEPIMETLSKPKNAKDAIKKVKKMADEVLNNEG